MSNSKMLIDASHPEETRVVVLKGNRVDEFDFEAANRKQLRGNIYLAKVTRVEPSLQAAFIEYGGNRHGFLAFSEIHPDYYQIPHADRQALLEEEARANRDEDDEGRGGDERRDNRGGDGRRDNRGGEGRRDGRGGEAQSADGRGGETRKGGERGARGEGRDRGRGDRDRGQRRSRRHRRDEPATALERRGAADESVSELAPEDASFAPELFAPETVEVEDREHEAEPAPHDLAGDEPTRTVADDTEMPAAHAALADEAAEMPSPATDDLFRADAEGAETAPPVPTESDTAGEDAAAAVRHDEFEPEEGLAAPLSPAHHAGAEAGPTDDAHQVDAAIDADGERGIGSVEARGATVESEGEEPERDEEQVEQIGGDALSDVAPRPARLRRHYKIQEVIKRRQILLIQVVKEERGNKGAALTTYLSLAGRYSVLMPNTAKGGGISRKITDGDDRKRLKAIAQELDVPEGMGVILRTAGAARSPVEVRRDFEYLLRMWESVRELTLKSTAPTLVYEEGSLIKRSIRDLYSKEVEEIVVAGEAGFAEARDFMRMLMPNNTDSVQLYRDPQPMFAKSGVEAQLDAMFSAHVTLKSGGYLVINQTEALVAIDVNSGRSTREHNIEDTALRTNMEAADEVARQLRLRDLAGLIVVDFIDMEEGRNNRAVERRIKEALKNDRARIQIGRISHFGLLEMSRQRIRTGVLEGSTVACPHCAGAGTVRSTASIALHVLRLLEDALIKDASHDVLVRSRAEVALYILNQKRAKLVELEQRFGVTLTVSSDPTLTGAIYHAIERGELATPAIPPAPRQNLVRVDSIAPVFEPETVAEDEVLDAPEGSEADADGVAEGAEGDAASAEADGRRRRRRRRRRGRDRDGVVEASTDVVEPFSTAVEEATDPAPGPSRSDDDAVVSATVPEGLDGFEPGAAIVVVEALEVDGVEPVAAASPVDAPDEPAAAEAAPVEDAPRPRRSRRTAAKLDKEVDANLDVEPAPAPRRRRSSRVRAVEANPEPAAVDVPSTVAEGDASPSSSRPAADRDVGADTVEHHPASAYDSPAPDEPGTGDAAKAAPTPAPEAAAPDEPAAPAEVPDPARPKRSGWWQRAKTTFAS